MAKSIIFMMVGIFIGWILSSFINMMPREPLNQSVSAEAGRNIIQQVIRSSHAIIPKENNHCEIVADNQSSEGKSIRVFDYLSSFLQGAIYPYREMRYELHCGSRSENECSLSFGDGRYNRILFFEYIQGNEKIPSHSFECIDVP